MKDFNNKQTSFKKLPLAIYIGCAMAGMLVPSMLVNGAVPNDLNIYRAPTQGKKNLIMMVDSSAGMDDEQGYDANSTKSGKGAYPLRSIKDDYPACTNKPIGTIGTTVLDFVYQGSNTYMESGQPKGTFVYNMPYCNPVANAVSITDSNLSGQIKDASGRSISNSGSWKSSIDNKNYTTLAQVKAAPANVQEEFRQYIRDMKYSRMDRMKVAMTDLLSSTVIPNDVVMGTGNFSSQTSPFTFDETKTASANQPQGVSYYSDSGGLGSGLGTSAKILVPSAAMTTAQRWKMRVSITSLSSGARTPLSSALAEAGAYMLGSTTKTKSGTSYSNVNEPITNRKASGFDDSTAPSKNSNIYRTPITTTAGTSDSCDANGIFLLTNAAPTAVPATTAQTIFTNAYGGVVPSASATSIAKIGNGNTDFGWLQMGNFAAALNDNKRIKTAVAGFGNNFMPYKNERPGEEAFVMLNDSSGDQKKYYKCNSLRVGQSYTVNGVTTTLTQDTVNACNLGEKSNADASLNTGGAVGGYGEGGFYPILEPNDLIDSVQKFVTELELTLPTLNTGLPAIPVDTLNATQQLPFAYYSQFQPKVESTQAIGIWLGNIKKYKVINNTYKDNSATSIQVIDATTGNLNSTKDFWNSGSADNADATKGGALSKLPVQTTVGRQIYSNRTVNASTGAVSEVTNADTALTLIASKNNSDATGTAEVLRASKDVDRAYLLNLLGFGVTAPTPPANLTGAAQLRQMGATLNSTPVFFTTQSKIATKRTTIGTGADAVTYNIGDYINRKDYVLFGTNQGLLQVVDADTGVEKLTFLPKEMVDRQKAGFVAKSLQTSISDLYQGVDGPWAVYASYTSNGTDSNSLKASTLNAYGGLRRGGYNYYGLDLKDIETSSPKILFKVGPSQTAAGVPNGTCSNSSPLDCMGQSWSKPTTTWIKWKGKPQLVMIVGGGYDTQYDTTTFKSNTTATKGNGVYIFAANTNTGTNGTGLTAGDLLWWGSSSVGGDTNNTTPSSTNNTQKKYDANLKYSVVSEIKAIDRDSDGFADNLYFGDLGGQVFRVDINNAASNSTANFVVKRIQRIGNFADADRASKAAPRFYNAPAFTVHAVSSMSGMRGGATRFAVVSIGSGDQSSPVSNSLTTANGIPDRVYAIFDRDIGRTDLYSNANDSDVAAVPGTTASADGLSTKDVTISSMRDLNTAPTVTNMAASSNNGWYNTLATTSTTLGRTGANIDGSLDDGIARFKVFGSFSAIKNTLFTSYFDAADVGFSGSCNAGVSGRSYVKNYCLPFGSMGSDGSNCGTADNGRNYTTATGIGSDMGAGVLALALGGMRDASGNSSIGPITGKGTGSGIKANYSTPLKLEPLKWYEKRT